jgi:hypothetical protein
MEFEEKKRSVDAMLNALRPQKEKGRTMTTEIEIQELINFETATDGTAVKIFVRDVANRKIGIILTIETLSRLSSGMLRSVSIAISPIRTTAPYAERPKTSGSSWMPCSLASRRVPSRPSARL